MCPFVAIRSLVELSANDGVKVSSGSECQLELVKSTLHFTCAQILTRMRIVIPILQMVKQVLGNNNGE